MLISGCASKHINTKVATLEELRLHIERILRAVRASHRLGAEGFVVWSPGGSQKFGVNPWRLQTWMGHKRIDETMLYVIDPDHQREVVRASGRHRRLIGHIDITRL